MSKKKHHLVESIIDPSSKELSMSRIASGCFVVLDVAWVIGCFFHWPHTSAYTPVSSMLAICTGAALAAYGVNSGGRTFATAWRYVKSRVDIPPGG